MINDFYAFRIIAGPELKTTTWTGASFDRDKPNDISDALSNLNERFKHFSHIKIVTHKVLKFFVKLKLFLGKRL